MDSPFNLRSWIKTREGRVAVALVAICSLLLGFFAWRTFIAPLPPQYDPDFAGARWIGSSSPNAYFRKDIFIPSGVKQGWIQLAATDSFELYVNGKPVGAETFVSTGVTGLYDLTRILTAGKNVIAVRVGRLSYPGAAQLLVRAAYRNETDHWRDVVSDDTWKVAPIPEGVPGAASWYDVELDDVLWNRAKPPEPMEPTPTIQPLDTEPRIFQSRPDGYWIGPSDPTVREVYFEKQIHLEGRPKAVWLQMAAAGSYEVVINDVLIATKNTGSAVLDLYPVTPLFRSGANSVLIHVRADERTAAWVLDGLAVMTDGSLRPFRSDASWHAGDQPAVVLAPYGAEPWGPLRKQVNRLELPSRRIYRNVLIAAVVMIGFLAGAGLLWWGSARLQARWTGADLSRALARDAFGHGVIIAAALFLWLLRYDVRFHADWPFRPAIAVGLISALLAMKIFLWIKPPGPREIGDRKRTAVNTAVLARYGVAALWTVILLGGFWLRIHDLGVESLNHDEVSMIKMARGVLTSGYPHAVIGQVDKALTTYELIPYPIALSAGLFGWTDWAVRLPAALFGTATILLIGLVGTRLFDRRTGLLAALIYALIPWSVQWARNAFYPQQTQFFALLTFYLFYEAAKTYPFDRRFVSWATAGVVLTYLSWEGTGFILPALGAALIAMHPADGRWLKDRLLWRSLGIVFLVIILQQTYRILSTAPYLAVGSGLSQVGLPTPFFLNPMYDPFYYLTNFLMIENHAGLTVLMLLGIPFCWRWPGFRFTAVLLIALIACYTNFLSASAGRYAYFFQPLLILLASGVVLKISEAVSSLGSRSDGPLPDRFGRAGFWIVAALLVASSSGLGLKLYRLGSSPEHPIQLTRYGVYGIDYRGPSRFVRERLRPGDAVIPIIPHAFEHYTGLSGDYFMDTLLAQRVVYNTGYAVPILSDRFSGIPVIRNRNEFEDALNRAGRVWIIAAPFSAFVASNDPSVIELLTRRAKIVYESYEAKVYLWEGVQPSQGAAGVTLEK
ncbi:MAG: glycosyltransferase family 39 protein [Nitrospirota bacterium]